jgi:2-hydroxy-6-oxonona-2,4-dienedioate hydrolase
MPTLAINGSKIVYEILGEGDPIILTPGGRFGKDIPGLRPLAEKLAESMQVVIWDRPNCGASELKFTGPSESRMAADDMVGLLQALDLAPAVLAGGSAGSRVSLIAAAHYPGAVRKLIMWNMSAGRYGTMYLAYRYLLLHINAAWLNGMDAVLEMPDIQESVRANPDNERIIREFDRDEFIETLTRWLGAYIPRENEPLPGVPAAEVGLVQAPTLVFRNGDNDIFHSAEVAYDLVKLIRESRLVEPPWPRDAWHTAIGKDRAGEGNMFDDWHLLAPQILEFVQE